MSNTSGCYVLPSWSINSGEAVLDNKRKARREKRVIKKNGNRKLRNRLKEDLRKNPEDSYGTDGFFKLGSSASKYLNSESELP